MTSTFNSRTTKAQMSLYIIEDLQVMLDTTFKLVNGVLYASEMSEDMRRASLLDALVVINQTQRATKNLEDTLTA